MGRPAFRIGPSPSIPETGFCRDADDRDPNGFGVGRSPLPNRNARPKGAVS
jgi:hypothetical protein